MSKNGNGEVVGFQFQEIPLEEALNVVLAGDGSYSEVKQMLLEKLPSLAPDKAFAFGLPGGKEVAEEARRGLCMTINATLHRAKLEWRITYSGAKKLFICVPKSAPRVYEKNGKTEYVPRSKWNQMDETPILELWRKNYSVSQIVKELGEGRERVKYVCYQKHPRKSSKLQPKTKVKVSPPYQKSLVERTEREVPLVRELKNKGYSLKQIAETTGLPRGRVDYLLYDPKLNKVENKTMSSGAAQLVAVARKVFNYAGDFKNGDSKVIRKAISVVGVNDLKIKPKDLAPLIGISGGGVSFNAKATSDFASREIKELQKAIKQEAN